MKRARRNEASDDLEVFAANEASPNLLSQLLSRISQLEESQSQVLNLQTRVATLEARVKELEREAIRAEDREFIVGRTSSKTMAAILDGEASVLEERLCRGADPNQDDGFGGTCLLASVCKGRPECTRLLIQYGGDVTRRFPSADDASLLQLLASAFRQHSASGIYRPEGDYVLTGDLLVEAGAPNIDEHRQEDGNPLSVLLTMDDPPEGTRRFRERAGLISVLDGGYWRDYGHNPFLRTSSSDAAAWLLLQGAADDKSTKRVDITRVRSIPPKERVSVMDALNLYQDMRETFVHILLTMRNETNDSPFCRLHGHESTILPLIASYAGSSGWSRAKLEESKDALQNAIERFNGNDGSYFGDLQGEIDDGDDDDSYELEVIGEDEEDGQDEEDGEIIDSESSDEGDY